MSADKRIPVTDETRRELHELKDPRQTYDDLLEEMVTRQRRTNLEARFQDLEAADSDELTHLEDA
ncbi:MAG: hypothetical protein ABEJ84_00565 [Halodesulfurarchaeum sp.]